MTNTLTVLIIATTHEDLGGTGHATGLWFEELTTPYYAFTDAGAQVTIASLPGCDIPIDPRSEDARGKNPASVERFLDDGYAMAQKRNSIKLVDISPDNYDVIFIPGGHGAMWDLASSRELGDFLTKAWAKGKIISSVCHGPAGLVNVREVDGKPLVAGKKVSAFSNSEEDTSGLAEVVPFLLETRLRGLGADYRSGPDFQAFAVRDGRLITGQNPESAGKVAELVLEAVGRKLDPVS